MKDKKKPFGDELIESVKEAVEIHEGRRSANRRFTFTDESAVNLAERRMNEETPIPYSEVRKKLGLAK